MINAIRHAAAEAIAAAARATDAPSKTRVALDFIISRLLKHVRLPNYNAPRRISMDGCKVNYRFNRGDLQSLREVLIEHDYELALPFQPRTVLDLGANIGLASLWFWQRYRPEKIIAVEPEAGNAAMAARNFSDNRIDGEVLRTAVGVESGTAWLAQRVESNLGEIFTITPTDKKISVEVPVTGITEIMARFGKGGVDLVKMDIEGGEGGLLGGDLAWLEGVRALVVEFHDDRLDGAHLIKRVRAAGFTHAPANAARQDNLGYFLKQSAN